MRLRYAVLVSVPLAAGIPGAAGAIDVCQHSGTTSYSGQVVVRTQAAMTSDGAIVIDVALTLRARAGLFWEVQYLVQEISTWQGRELQSVAVNNRSISSGRIVRQQWDVFTRGAAGLEARRVQGKTLAEFRSRHPTFVRHWDPASFGAAWVADFAAARPERRPDLDLPRAAMPAGLRTPLAMAFYWARWLPPGGQTVPLFLPGFKRDARAELTVLPPESPAGAGQPWQVRLRHPGLRTDAMSVVQAWVSPDQHVLQQISFDLHASPGSAQGVLRSTGCQGAPLLPGAG